MLTKTILLFLIITSGLFAEEFHVEKTPKTASIEITINNDIENTEYLISNVYLITHVYWNDSWKQLEENYYTGYFLGYKAFKSWVGVDYNKGVIWLTWTGSEYTYINTDKNDLGRMAGDSILIFRDGLKIQIRIIK